MEFVISLVAAPLGYLMYYAYAWVGNYGWAILLFTLATKVLMFPLSLLSQKNSIKMVKLQPMLTDIQQRYSGNPGMILQEQKKLYQREKYSAWVGLLPLLLQIPLILGLINVVYNPMAHLLHLEPGLIRQLVEAAGLPQSASIQSDTIRAIQMDPSAFSALIGDPGLLSQILGLDFHFFGLDLSVIPTFTSLYALLPLLSGLSSLLLSTLQNKYNVLQREQGFVGKWGMALFLVLFSGYFAFIVPAGIGLYWIMGNLLSIAVLFLCNRIYNPTQYINYANRSVKPTLTKEEKADRAREKKLAKARERQDEKRFFSQKKQLVFYSEGSGFYKYFERIIRYLLDHSDLDIHYVTSDFHDRIFQTDNPRLIPYYIGDVKLISFMMRMDADMVVMTMPDLDQYHIKRSIVKKDVEYVYLHHGAASFHMMLREHALDAFDTILCCGPHQAREIRELEKLHGLPEKKILEAGYGLLDTLLEKAAALPQASEEVPQVLIAPSWQKDSIMEFCLNELLAQLLHREYRVILRPHPEFVKRFPDKIKAIQTQYRDALGEGFVLETDFSSNETIYASHVVITDWSSIVQEFSYATKRPSIFINTPMKINNPNYQKIPLVPLDISQRDQIGVSLNVEELDRLPAIVEEMLEHPDRWRERITKALEENIFAIGHSARVSGEYIMEALAEKARQGSSA